MSDQKHHRRAVALPVIISQANLTDEEVTKKKATAGENFSTFFFIWTDKNVFKIVDGV